MNTLSLRVFLLIPVLVSVVFAQKFESKHFKIEKLSDGVFVAIHSFGGYAICNSGIVEIGNKVLVFDTFLTPEAAKDLKKAVESLTGKSVTYVINSHAHNDHIRGNQVFNPNSVIISTNNIRKQIEKDEPKQIAYEKENVAERLSQMKRNYETAEDDATKMEYYMWIGFMDPIELGYYMHIQQDIRMRILFSICQKRKYCLQVIWFLMACILTYHMAIRIN
jgi:hypothetical protein